jgi:hypothetical protein
VLGGGGDGCHNAGATVRGAVRRYQSAVDHHGPRIRSQQRRQRGRASGLQRTAAAGQQRERVGCRDLDACQPVSRNELTLAQPLGHARATWLTGEPERGGCVTGEINEQRASPCSLAEHDRERSRDHSGARTTFRRPATHEHDSSLERDE